MYESDLQEVISKLNIIIGAYDKVRIVDPVNKQVINLRDNGTEGAPEQCFAFWKKGQVCENCISMKAYRENDTFIKMEYSEEDIYLVTAFPIELTNRTVVLELMKKATDNISINVNGDDASSNFNALLNNLNNRAIKDSLTGIYNRRYINEKLPLDLINASLSDSSISVIMVDIDFFKNVNDTYGHLIGDCTLKSIANTLNRNLKRDNDWVARYGGEEFLICLPGAHLENAKEMAELIRKKVESTPIDCGDLEFFVTASFGVSSVTPKSGASITLLIEEADKKLYEAKRNGRNRVEA
ncbi:MAG: diguanylate cyclase [Herbinix sp.]|jgi:diguanylate cyclase (GGDEF)-like protein|nr:diguanylate cyclase [Herbinix sp.]